MNCDHVQQIRANEPQNVSHSPDAHTVLEYHQIAGWFDFEDVYSYVTARCCSGHFVEVGSFLGKSTCFLAMLIRDSGKPIRLDAVDTWKGSEGEPVHAEIRERVGGDLYAEFCTNLCRCKVDQIVQPVRLSSTTASRGYADRSLDFVFIDASHKYEDVRDDVLAWLPKVKLTGIIAGHDYGWDGVRRAVDECFGPNVTIWKNSWLHLPANRGGMSQHGRRIGRLLRPLVPVK